MSASLIGRDTTTQGSWIGVYGAQGYDVIGNAAKLPAYATVTPSSQLSFVWAASTSDTRALQTANGSSRIASCWYGNSPFSVDVDFTDGNLHTLTLYVVDWDTSARAEQIQISNASTGSVLDTETVTAFHGGVYLRWSVSGNLMIKFTKTAGANAVLSGIFFDAPPVTGNAVSATSMNLGNTVQAASGTAAAHLACAHRRGAVHWPRL